MKRLTCSCKIIFLIPLLLICRLAYSQVEQKEESHANLQNKLKNHVKFLTSLTPARTYPNAGSLTRAAHYIQQQFLISGKQVTEQPFVVHGKTYRNVSILFGSAKNKRIVVGAHYDVCGNQPGADDNASGVAIIVELASLLKNNQIKLRHSVELVAFALEEPPWFRTPNMGSAVHARSLAKNKIKVKLMISVDMIGWFAKKGSRSLNANIPLYPPVKSPANTSTIVGLDSSRKLIKKTWKLMEKGSTLKFVYAAAPRHTPTIDFSDHLNYWNHDYPALLISNGFVALNPRYHKPTDTMDTLNFANMAQLTHSLMFTILHL